MGSGEGREKTFQENGMGCTHPRNEKEQRILKGCPLRIEHRDTNQLGVLVSLSNGYHVPTLCVLLPIYILSLIKIPKLP